MERHRDRVREMERDRQKQRGTEGHSSEKRWREKMMSQRLTRKRGVTQGAPGRERKMEARPEGRGGDDGCLLTPPRPYATPTPKPSSVLPSTDGEIEAG